LTIDHYIASDVKLRLAYEETLKLQRQTEKAEDDIKKLENQIISGFAAARSLALVLAALIYFIEKMHSDPMIYYKVERNFTSDSPVKVIRKPLKETKELRTIRAQIVHYLTNLKWKTFRTFINTEVSFCNGVSAVRVLAAMACRASPALQTQLAIDGFASDALIQVSFSGSNMEAQGAMHLSHLSEARIPSSKAGKGRPDVVHNAVFSHLPTRWYPVDEEGSWIRNMNVPENRSFDCQSERLMYRPTSLSTRICTSLCVWNMHRNIDAVDVLATIRVDDMNSDVILPDEEDGAGDANHSFGSRGVYAWMNLLLTASDKVRSVDNARQYVDSIQSFQAYKNIHTRPIERLFLDSVPKELANDDGFYPRPDAILDLEDADSKLLVEDEETMGSTTSRTFDVLMKEFQPCAEVLDATLKEITSNVNMCARYSNAIIDINAHGVLVRTQLEGCAESEARRCNHPLDIVAYILKSDCTGRYVQVLHEQDITLLRQLFSSWKHTSGTNYASCDLLYRISVWDVLTYALLGSQPAIIAPSLAPSHAHQMVGPQLESCVEFYDHLCSLTSEAENSNEEELSGGDSARNARSKRRALSNVSDKSGSDDFDFGTVNQTTSSEHVVSRDSAVFSFIEEACTVVYAYHPLNLTAFGGYGSSSTSIFNRALRLLSAFAAVDAVCTRKTMQIVCNTCDAAGLWSQHEPDIPFIYPFILVLQVLSHNLSLPVPISDLQIVCVRPL
jgi:hypothetical protein